MEKRRGGERIENKDEKEGGRGERTRSQRQSLNKADLLFPPGVQQPALFPPSLCYPFLSFPLSAVSCLEELNLQML